MSSFFLIFFKLHKNKECPLKIPVNLFFWNKECLLKVPVKNIFKYLLIRQLTDSFNPC